jgi:hypothetical protein
LLLLSGFGSIPVADKNICIDEDPNPDNPEPNRFEDKKIDHESTKD